MQQARESSQQELHDRETGVIFFPQCEFIVARREALEGPVRELARLRRKKSITQYMKIPIHSHVATRHRVEAGPAPMRLVGYFTILFSDDNREHPLIGIMLVAE